MGTTLRGVIAAMAVAAGCHSSNGALPAGFGDAREAVVTKLIPVSADFDVLFVIDNSAGITDKQTIFAANFPRFVAGLDAFPTGRPNLHVGVVTTTVDIGAPGFGPGCPSPAPNDNGLLQNAPRVTGCATPTGRFISDIKNGTGGRTINYDPSAGLATVFSCIAQVGATGCGFEAPLEAMKRALDGSRPENAGFLRNGANLVVVILADEDDCSVKDPSLFSLDSGAAGPGDFRCQPLYAYTCDSPISATAAGTYAGCTPRTDSYLQDPAAYFAFLASVKRPEQLAVAMIVGDPKLDASRKASIATGAITSPFQQSLALLPSCTAVINGNSSIGRPGIRLASFLANFGPDRGRQYTACQPDYGAALSDIAQLMFDMVSPCLEGKVDTRDVDANNPGVQLACSVTDVQNLGTGSETDSVLPPCKMSSATAVDPSSAKPCWWTAANETACPTTTTHFGITLERAAPPATGTSTLVSCVATP